MDQDSNIIESKIDRVNNTLDQIQQKLTLSLVTDHQYESPQSIKTYRSFYNEHNNQSIDIQQIQKNVKKQKEQHELHKTQRDQKHSKDNLDKGYQQYLDNIKQKKEKIRIYDFYIDKCQNEQPVEQSDIQEIQKDYLQLQIFNLKMQNSKLLNHDYSKQLKTQGDTRKQLKESIKWNIKKYENKVKTQLEGEVKQMKKRVKEQKQLEKRCEKGLKGEEEEILEKLERLQMKVKCEMNQMTREVKCLGRLNK